MNLQHDDDPYLPTFLPTPNNVTFLSGEEAVLQCAIENRGTRTVIRHQRPAPLRSSAASLHVTSSLALNTSSVEEDNKLNLSVVIADMMHLMSHVREVLFLTSGRCEAGKNAVDAQAREDSHARRTGAILTEVHELEEDALWWWGGGVETQGWKEQVERRN
ncbi:hypothetical protein C0Q70_20485 [Pomacea canaliculata]|uniref:Uncharacterized protein n=1 Tax=Pomacea canaliculata TaxID=400727 RepID=A0A2T7NFP5_POMCA|nr:hypothetical protein C0Q70_20485 [Pomacea canaliculata]